MKRPENSAHFPASHLPHPFPSKPRERRRTRSYKKPPQERSEEEAAEEEEEEGGAGKERGEDEPGASPGRCSPFLPWGRGRRGGAGPRAELGFASSGFTSLPERPQEMLPWLGERGCFRTAGLHDHPVCCDRQVGT